MEPYRPRWPERLWIVRHGESAGNVAFARAQAAGHDVVDIAVRDVDVPLSALGERQADALGRWFAGLPARPDVVMCSTYLRARETARRVAAVGGTDVEPRCFRVDERLREREFGVLDRLTRAGVEARYPDQAEFRRLLGKFYHRPPGGESWADVILRLRALMDTVSLHHAGRRVLVVAHQVVVLCLRYVLEDLDEGQVLAIDAAGDVANCSVTEYAFPPGADGRRAPELVRYNHVAPVEAGGEAVTRAPDAPVAAR